MPPPLDIFPDPGGKVVRIVAMNGVTRYRTRFPQVKIPIIDSPIGPAFPNRFFPLGKLSIDGIMLNTACAPLIACQGCFSWPYQIEDTTRACSFTVMKLFSSSEALPPVIEFQIRQSVDNIPTVRFTGIYTPSTFNTTGLLVAIEGDVAMNEWEIWGRIIPGPGAAPLEWVIAVCANAEGVVDSFWPGPDVVGTMP